MTSLLGQKMENGDGVRFESREPTGLRKWSGIQSKLRGKLYSKRQDKKGTPCHKEQQSLNISAKIKTFSNKGA